MGSWIRRRHRQDNTHSRAITLESLETRRLLAGDVLNKIPDKPFEADSTDVAPRVVGGFETEKGKWPWMASLQTGGHFCGGSLIAPDVVLTAAHCVEGNAIGDFDVVLGLHELTDSGTRHQLSEIIVHPDYDPVTNDSDVAILLLDSASDLTPIPLITPALTDLARPGAPATAIGWGDLGNGTSPNELQEVSVPIISTERANEPQSYNGAITDTMLVAGVLAGGRDTCQGDSGGPLMVSDSLGQRYLAGVTSWGHGCAQRNSPGVYGRVSVFADWITSESIVDSMGTIRFDREQYGSNALVEVRLSDADLAGQDNVNVEIKSDSGDVETIRFEEFVNGRFRGQIRLSDNPVSIRNGQLEVIPGANIEVSYADAFDGTGKAAEVIDSAMIFRDDHGNSAGTATAIALDVAVGGELEVADDNDWFAFNAQAGREYEIRVLLNGSLDDSELFLYDSTGDVELAYNDDGGASLASEIFWQATTDGPLHAAVRGYGRTAGTYELIVTEFVPLADDHGNSATNATPVEIGSSTSGAMGDSDDQDWFSFPVTEGTRYAFSTELDTLGDSTLTLYAEDGVTELQFNDDAIGRASRIDWTSTYSGTAYLNVEGYIGSIGDYVLYVDVQQRFNPNATSIDLPYEGQGNLSVNEQADYYSFQATAGSTYIIETELSQGDSVLRVFDEFGSELEFNDDGGVALASRIEFSPVTSGQYFIEVTDYSSGELSYSLRASEAAPGADDHGDSSETATPILVNSTTAGQIGSGSDQDWFSFSVSEGMTYVLETSLGTLSDSTLALIGQDGFTELSFNDDFAGLESRIRWTADFTGSVYASVRGFSVSTGSYELSLTQSTTEEITPIDIPSTTQGSVTTNGPALFSFTAVAGAAYQFETELITLGDSTLEILDESGNVLVFNDDFNGLASLVQFTPQLGGTYFVSVDDFLGETGSFRLIATQIEDPPNMTLDVPSTTLGELLFFDSADQYAFSVTSGTTYEITVDLLTLADSTLTLLGADGTTELAFDDDGGVDLGSMITWTSTYNGTAFALVEGFFGETGSYELTIVEQVISEISIPSVTEGSTPSTYSFQAAAGNSYTFETELLTLSDSTLEILDQDNNVLVFDDDGGADLASRLEFLPTTSGTYFVRVAGYLDELGTFRLIANLENPEDDHGDSAAEATAISDRITNGVIDYAGDPDWFAFPVTANTTYEVTIDLNTLGDSTLTLFASDGGTELAFDDDSGNGRGSQLIWTSTFTGTAYAVAEGFAGSSTGSYELAIEEVIATPIAVGGSAIGDIEMAGERDEFSFEAVAGGTYDISTELLGLPDSTLEILDQFRNSLFFDDDGGNDLASFIRFTPEEAGTYIIRVAGYEESVGTYEVFLTRFDAPTDDHGDAANSATSAPIGSETGVSISGADDPDWLSFEARSGLAYRFHLTGQSFGDLTFEIYDRDGQSILQTEQLTMGETDSTYHWIAENTGTYYLRFSSLSSADLSLANVIPYGDANLDGVFNSADLIQIFAQAEFEDDMAQNSTWSDGDWDGDGDFTTTDLIFAFQANSYVITAIPGAEAAVEDFIFDTDSERTSEHGSIPKPLFVPRSHAKLAGDLTIRDEFFSLFGKRK